MRNPGLRLVGIRSSQGGRGGGGGSFVTSGDIGDIGVFGNNRAEEELRLWLESRLDALGIDPVAYSRFVLSLLRHPDSALSPINQQETTATIGRRNRARARSKIPDQGDREQRRAVVQCLTNAADQKCGVESLVDELCAKLRDLEGGGASEDNKDETQKLEDEKPQQQQQQQQQQQLKNNFESLTPRDRALRYYAAFPALQPATPKKNSNHKKEKNLGTNSCSFNNNNNHNINNNNNNNNNKNRNTTGVNGNNNNKNNNKTNTNGGNSNSNKGRHKKTKMSIQAIEPVRTDEKESSFSFAKSMEREREKERELELDQLRLAQLQAKFDESLEALWDSGPGNPQDKASIWAAPSLSIPSGPLWPIDTGELPLILPLNDSSVSSATTPYQESVVDDSPIIPWDIDFTVGKATDEVKDKLDYNLNWSEYVGEGPWSWKTLDNNNSPKSTFFAVPKTPAVKEADDEDLLTSARTHFCPIKDDGNWADGTTFPVNNNFERVAYRRSESGNLLYLPGGESPYMEYRDEAATSAVNQPAFSLKFRVKQCDKSIQTDPIRSPIKRRIVAEEDHFYFAEIEAEDIISREVEEEHAEDKDSFGLGQLGWMQPSVSLLNDRKRRHSSSFKCRPLAALRPLTL